MPEGSGEPQGEEGGTKGRKGGGEKTPGFLSKVGGKRVRGQRNLEIEVVGEQHEDLGAADVDLRLHQVHAKLRIADGVREGDMAVSRGCTAQVVLQESCFCGGDTEDEKAIGQTR